MRPSKSLQPLPTDIKNPSHTEAQREIIAAVPVGLLGPPIHNMGPCSRPGEDPNAWKQFGPKPDPGNRASVASIHYSS